MNKFMRGGSLLSLVGAISIVVVFVLAALQLYVRWYLNQTFTLLGGWELEALTVSSFALLIALVRSHHGDRN